MEYNNWQTVPGTKAIDHKHNPILTKRDVLQTSSLIYDPLVLSGINNLKLVRFFSWYCSTIIALW